MSDLPPPPTGDAPPPSGPPPAAAAACGRGAGLRLRADAASCRPSVGGAFYSVGLAILLMIVTLGIWGFFWTWHHSEDLKKYNGDGLGGGIALVIYFFVSPVLMFTIPNEIKNMYERDGRQSPVSAIWGLWFLLPLIGNIIWYVKVQHALNDFWVSKGAPRGLTRSLRPPPAGGEWCRSSHIGGDDERRSDPVGQGEHRRGGRPRDTRDGGRAPHGDEGHRLARRRRPRRPAARRRRRARHRAGDGPPRSALRPTSTCARCSTRASPRAPSPTTSPR